MNSDCLVALSIKEQNDTALLLSLTGTYSHFPSTSNLKQVAYRKAPNGTRLPFIITNSKARNKLQEMADCFTANFQKLSNSIVMNFTWPLFDQCTVWVMLAHKTGRWDSHNQCKPIGDWLQKLQIIKDDSNCEILCFKKSDYPDMFKDSLFSTEILIQSRQQSGIALKKLFSSLGILSMPYVGRNKDVK